MVSRLRSSDARVASWSSDSVTNLVRLMLLASYGAVFFKEQCLADRLRAPLGPPAYYLPQAYSAHWDRPVHSAGTEPCPVTADKMYPSRTRQLERLIAKGITLRQPNRGFLGWVGGTAIRAASTGYYIARQEKAQVFRAAAKVLKILPVAEGGVHARPFEAADCRAAVITGFRPAVPDPSAIGREVSTVYNFDDLLAQTAKALRERGLTTRLGETAAQRAYRDHTHDLRVTAILANLS